MVLWGKLSPGQDAQTDLITLPPNFGRVKLSRHMTRSALAKERVQTNAAGQVLLKLKTL